MASKEVAELSIGISIDTGNTQKDITSINKAIKNTEKDFKSAGKGVDNFEKTFTGLDAKIKKTSKQIELYNIKLDKQKEAHDKLKSTLDKQVTKLNELEQTVGRGSEEWNKQAELVQKNSTKLQGLKTNITQTESQIKKLGNELEDASQEFEQLGRVTQTIDEKLNNITRSADLAESEFSLLGSELQNNGDYFKRLGNDIQQLASKMKNTQQKVDAYEVEINKLSTTLNSNKEDHRKLATEINNTENELNQSKKTFGENSTEAMQLKSKLLQLKDEYNSLETEINQGNNALDGYQTELNNTQRELNELSRELKQLPLERLGNDLVSSGQQIKGMGQSLTSNLTVPLTGAGVAAGTLAYSFDQGLAKVGSLVDKSGKEMRVYEEQVLDVCKNLGISTEDMTEAWYSAISAGVELGDSISFVESAGKLAVAGFTNTASSVDILTTSLNIYGDKAGTAQEIANKLLLVQNKGKTTVDELSSSMGQSLSIGGQYSVSFDNIATAFAKATLAGNTTADAGTQIKSMLSELGDSGSKVSKILIDKTGKSFKQLMEEGYSLSDALKIVQEKAEKSGVGIGEMFSSSEAGLGAMSLLSEEGLNFNDTLAEMSGELDLVDTGFNDMKESAGANLLDAINSLKLSLIAMGDTLAPVITWLAEKLEELSSWFSNLDEDGRNTVLTMAGIALAIGPVLSAVGTLISVGGSLTLMFNGARTGASLFSTILGTLGSVALPAIILALAGLAISVGDNSEAILGLQEKFGAFGFFVGGTCEFISGVAQALFGGLLIGFQTIGEAIVAAISGRWKDIPDIIEQGGEKMTLNNQEALDKMLLTTTIGMDNLRNATDTQLKGTVDSMGTIMDAIPNIVDGKYRTASNNLGKQLANMDTQQINILQGMNDTTRMMFSGIKEGMSVEEASKTVEANLKQMATAGKIDAETMNRDVSNAIETMKQQMDTKTKQGGQSVDKNTKDAGNKAKSNMDKAAVDVGNATDKAKQQMDNKTKEASSAVDRNTKDAGNKAKSNMDKAATDVGNATSKMATEAKKGTSKLASNTDADMKNANKAVQQSATDMYNGSKNSYSKMADVATSEGTRMYKGVSTSTKKMADNAKSSASDMYRGVTTSTRLMADSAINDWNRIRNAYSKPITGKVTKTTVNKVVTTKTDNTKSIHTNPMTTFDIPLIDEYRIDGGFYNNTSEKSKKVLEHNNNNNKTNELLEKLINIINKNKNTDTPQFIVQIDGNDITKVVSRRMARNVNKY